MLLFIIFPLSTMETHLYTQSSYGTRSILLLLFSNAVTPPIVSVDRVCAIMVVFKVLHDQKTSNEFLLQTPEGREEIDRASSLASCDSIKPFAATIWIHKPPSLVLCYYKRNKASQTRPTEESTAQHSTALFFSKVSYRNCAPAA